MIFKKFTAAKPALFNIYEFGNQRLENDKQLVYYP